MHANHLDERLRAAAELVRPGAVFADVGTDHAYLPVFLCHTGKVIRAVAADIGRGPLAAAATHIKGEGLEHKIATVLTDGLHGLEAERLTDIAICGMGGELIVKILSEAPFVKDARVRLVLQPMTRAAALRTYLAEAGFAVRREITVEAGGRPYFCLAAEYTGVPYRLTRAEAELGQYNLSAPPTAAFARLLSRAVKAAERRVVGLTRGDRDAEAERAYLQELRGYLAAHTTEETQ